MCPTQGIFIYFLLQSTSHLIVSFLRVIIFLFLSFFCYKFLQFFFFYIFHYFFALTYFVFIFQVTKVLSIISPSAPPIQKVCGNYHVAYVIICSIGDVHCNVYCSKSKVHKIRFFMKFHCNQ